MDPGNEVAGTVIRIARPQNSPMVQFDTTWTQSYALFQNGACLVQVLPISLSLAIEVECVVEYFTGCIANL